MIVNVFVPLNGYLLELLSLHANRHLKSQQCRVAL